MSSRRLRSQGLEPPLSGGRNRGSSSVPAEIGGGAVRSSARLRTRRQTRPLMGVGPLQPREENTREEVSREESPEVRGLRGGRGRPTAARQESSARSSQVPRPRSGNPSIRVIRRSSDQEVIRERIERLRVGLRRPAEPREIRFPLNSQEQVPRHSHQWHIPVEVSREAAPEASGRSRGRGGGGGGSGGVGGGGRPVPTFHDDQRQMPAPVLQVWVAVLSSKQNFEK